MNKNITPMQILEELHDLNDRFGEMGFPVSVFVNGDRYPVANVDVYYNYDAKRNPIGVHSMDINIGDNSSPSFFIAAAKKVLSDAGFFVDNLWHIEDVTSRYKCDEATAMAVLESALTNEATMEQIWFAIKEEADYQEYKTKDDDE